MCAAWKSRRPPCSAIPRLKSPAEVSNSAAGRRHVDVSALAPAIDDFAALFADYYVPLTRLIYRVVGDAGVAEELASEAFWRLHQSPAANPMGWLCRTGLRL